MSSSVKISVIVPVYNVRAFLPDCLRSLAGQTFKETEVLLVDDGSTDGSAEELSSFAKQYPQARVLTQPNQGVAAARKTALAHAQAQTICFVDADDILDACYLQELWDVYCQTKAPVVVARMVRFPAEKQPPMADFFHAGTLRGANRVRVFEDFSAAMALCGKLIKRSYVTEIDFPTARTGDDILPSVSLLSASDPIALAPKAVYLYRERPGSQSRGGSGRFEGLLNGFTQARKVLKQQGTYNDFAPGFEYVCRVCLTSFMEKYGLTAAEEKALKAVAGQTRVAPSLFKNRSWRFRLRQRLLNSCLSFGISYATCWRLVRRFYGNGCCLLKSLKNQAKSLL